MTKFLRLLLFTLLSIAAGACSTTPCYGQAASPESTTEQHLVPRVPGSPTAAALERYALMPISEPTGTPDISLPLLQAKSGSLELPLSLNYHASGIRVDDEASWVGLGWSLNAGGVITRIVRGKADESSAGFMENFQNLPDMTTLDDGKDFNLFRLIAAQRLDYEPDLFTYSFPGGSGTFLLGNDGTFHAMPYAPLQISATRRGALLDFTLVDNTGTTYAFTEQEFTVSHRQGLNGPTNCSAWYLTQIVSADYTDTIRLAYDHHTISYGSGYYQSQSVPQGNEPGLGLGNPSPIVSGVVTSSSNNSVMAARLREIVFREGRIAFVAKGQRADIISDKRLATIALLRPTGIDTIRKITLQHSYFNADLSMPDAAAKSAYLRLRLDALQTTGGDQELPPHRFTYSGVRLPTRSTGPRDHWGYANEAYQKSPAPGSAPTLIPRVRVPIMSGAPDRAADGTIEVGNANREPNPAYVQAGLLQKITYPTGGYVTYSYEPNTALAETLVPAAKATHYQEATGTGVNTVVRQTKIVALGSYVANLTGTIAVRRYNDVSHNYLHNAGGTITITDITPGSNAVVFTFNIKGNKNGVIGADTPYSVYFSKTLPELKANHTYEIVSEARGEDYDANVNLQWETEAPRYHKVAKVFGGVRVKTVRFYAAPRQPTQTRSYSYDTPGTTLTSGYSSSPFIPTYDYEQITRRGISGMGEHGDCNVSGFIYRMVTSQPIGELHGSSQSVGYAYVTVKDSATSTSNNGQIVSRYSTEQMRGNLQKPYPPAVDLSWKRGNLEQRWTYREVAGAALRLVEQQINEYTDVDDFVVNGFRVIADVSYSGCAIPAYEGDNSGNASLPQYANRFAYSSTYQISQWHYLSRSRQYRYAPAADTTQYLLTTTSYAYGSRAHGQPTEITTTSSTGATETVYKRYAADYTIAATAAPTALAVREMARRRINSSAIETWTVRSTATTQAVVTRGEIQLPTLINQIPVLQKALAWESAQPKAASQFTPLRVVNNSLVSDPEYQEKVIIDRYDARNNVVEQHRPGDLPISYLWDYNGRLLAKVQNAHYADITATLGQETLAQLTSKSAGPDAQVRQQLQALRRGLPKAQVTTYTHALLLGMTSQTGPDGRTIFYEYDGLGRLLRVRDEQNRILSAQEYQYGL